MSRKKDVEDELRSEAFEILDRIEAHVTIMPERDVSFVEGLLERREHYGEKTAISRKQVFWLRDILERVER